MSHIVAVTEFSIPWVSCELEFQLPTPAGTGGDYVSFLEADLVRNIKLTHYTWSGIWSSSSYRAAC